METRKYFQVAYTKKIGGKKLVNVIARNKAEAIANAKDNIFTGSNFYVLRELKNKPKKTVKGGGSHRMN